MRTIKQVVAQIAADSTQDQVILSLTNAGGSSRLYPLKEIFDEEQIDALEEGCVISGLHDLPDEIRNPENLRSYMDFNGISMITIHWTTIRADGSIVEYDIDDTRVF